MTEELIEASTASARPAKEKRLLGGLMLAVLVLTGGAEVLMPPKPFVLLGQEKAAADRAAAQLSFWDGSLAQSIETRFKLRGRVRRLLAPYWAAAMLQLKDAPGDDIIVGKDGWLFLRDRALLSPERAARGRETLANHYGLVRRSLHSGGIDLVCVPIPRKAAACAERLPDGLDPNIAFDHSVEAALRQRGLDVIDLWPHWEKLTPEERFLRYDTHWALPARLETAKQIGRQGEQLPRKTLHYSYRYGEDKSSTGELRYAGVDHGHPAQGWFDPEVDREVLLIPEGAEESLNSGETESDVMLVGSSFSAAYWMHAILCNMLQAPVEDASEHGQPPIYSMWKAIVTRSEEALPRFIVSEFPIYQAAETGGGSVEIVRASLGLARYFGYRDRTVTLDEELFVRPFQAKPVVGKPVVHFGVGSILSSGDGVLGLQLTVEGDALARWQVNSSGASAEIATKPGVRVRTLPIVENGEDLAHFAWVRPLTEDSLTSTVTARIVTDADLAGGLRFRGDSDGPGLWRASPDLTVASYDSLALSWAEPTTGATALIAKGTNRAGDPVERRWEFARARAVRFLIVTLGPFEGGRLDSLELQGAGTDVVGTLAGQLP